MVLIDAHQIAPLAHGAAASPMSPLLASAVLRKPRHLWNSYTAHLRPYSISYGGKCDIHPAPKWPQRSAELTTDRQTLVGRHDFGVEFLRAGARHAGRDRLGFGCRLFRGDHCVRLCVWPAL